MNVIIAAVIAAALLLWGGIAGLLRIVDRFERKHMLFLGAYATLVAGSVMSLVLYTNSERQKEHRRDLQAQMEDFSGRLNELSEKLVKQLDEKAQLTASEFEIRVKLQNEIKSRQRTQQELAAQIEEYRALKQTLDQELAAHRQYRDEVEQNRQERFAQEEARYRDLRDSFQVSQRALQTAQKQLSVLQEDLGDLNTQVAGMQKTQTALLARVNSNLEVFRDRTQELMDKIDTLADSQSGSRAEIDAIRTRVDSLFKWETK